MRISKNKELLVLVFIGGIAVFMASAFKSSEAPQKVQEHENELKILPKDITHDELIAVMKSFESALNFSCRDCHAVSATDSTRLDFESDANPKKKQALEMMAMVEEINKKNFDVSGDFKDNYLQSKYKVSCVTCHNGHAEPSQRISVPVRLRDLQKPKEKE